MSYDGIGRRIAAHRRRRGLSQAAVAALVGRSESWLSQVERGVRSVDRMSVLLDLSRVLRVDVPALTGVAWQLTPDAGPRAAEIEEIRGALARCDSVVGDGAEAPSPDELHARASEVHDDYQSARYASVTRALPRLLSDADRAASGPLAHVEAYVVASKLLTKLGVADLAAVTADRAATAAGRSGSAVARGMAVYQVVAALMQAGQVDHADALAVRMAQRLAPRARADDPALVSVTGALWLIAAVIAARLTDGWEAEQRIDRADELATLLGHDGNHARTAFGPTNVAIHRVSVAAELGDPAAALDAASRLDVEALPPSLRSRRAQVNLDLAWANAQRRRDAETTLNLLAAEEVAPEAVGQNVVAREVLREMLARATRAKRADTTVLYGLAGRAGILA